MSESSMGKLQALTQPPGVVEFFQGLFDRVGVKIIETGEAFTGKHKGDKIEFASGINEPEVDFTVAITTEQVDRLSRHVDSGELDSAEEFSRRNLRASIQRPRSSALSAPCSPRPRRQHCVTR